MNAETAEDHAYWLYHSTDLEAERVSYPHRPGDYDLEVKGLAWLDRDTLEALVDFAKERDLELEIKSSEPDGEGNPKMRLLVFQPVVPR